MRSPALRFPKSLWSYNPIPGGCVLYLPLWSPGLNGSAFKSVDPYGHECTVTGAVQVADGRDFELDNPDYIELASESVMDFTSGGYSIIARLNAESLPSAENYIFMRGLRNTEGYEFILRSDGVIIVVTNQAAASQITYGSPGAASTDTWYTISFSRDGTSIRTYADGVDTTDTVGTHTNPVTSSRTVKIGVHDNKSGTPFDGIIETLLVYNRALSAAEHLYAHSVLRWRT